MDDDKVTVKRLSRKPLAVGQKRSGRGGSPSIDWTAMEAEFISSPGLPLYEDLAKKYGSTRRSVAAKAREGKWPAKRESANRAVIEAAAGESVVNRAAKLVLWNEESLLDAGWLREAARKLYMRRLEGDRWEFNGTIDHKSISAAAAAHVAADKLARLALGASTENTENRHSLPTSVDDFV